MAGSDVTPSRGASGATLQPRDSGSLLGLSRSNPFSSFRPAASVGSLAGEGRVDLAPVPVGARWTWGLRTVCPSEGRLARQKLGTAPRVGDVALVRVEEIGYHAAVVSSENRKLRIYPGDLVVGVFGNRYATDAYEAQVEGVERLSLLTAGGMLGTVRSRHRDMGRPTSLSFVGFVVDVDGRRLNLKERLFGPEDSEPQPCSDRLPPLLVVVGTGMNSGKTTVVSQALHGLSRQGFRVAAGKLTGSVSNRDVDEMRAAGAVSVIDFSDYGFPSTCQADFEELGKLWRRILSKSSEGHPDFLMMEIADGVLQRETAAILGDPAFRLRVSGVLLAADCSLSALAAVHELARLGYGVVGVSGAITSAPLFVREFEGRSDIPVVPSTGVGTELAMHVLERLAYRSGPGATVPEETPIRRDEAAESDVHAGGR